LAKLEYYDTEIQPSKYTPELLNLGLF